MKFIFLLLAFAPTVFCDAFNFPTTGCVDEAATNTCLAAADANMAADCTTLCGCTDAFTCTKATDACLAGCVCVATQTYINCILSSCWNKVHSCEYQQLVIDTVDICPIAVAAGIPYFESNATDPGACSCGLSKVWATNFDAPLRGLNCSKINFQAAASQQCLCCSVQESISAYYDFCDATDPSFLPASIKLPWGYFAGCEGTLAGTDCTNPDLGFPPVAKDLLFSTMQPNGTASFSNQGGSLTSPPYGSTTAWYLFGSTGAAATATAVAYTPGKQGSQESQGSGSTAGATGTDGAASATGSGSKSGSKSGAAKLGSSIILLVATFGLSLALV